MLLFFQYKSAFFLVLLLILSIKAFAQKALTFSETPVELKTDQGTLYGTLLLPAGGKTVPVALIIAGSGPTDRDGNNPMMKNNHLKLLAEGLAQKGIATLRYDKRGIGQSQQAGLAEKDLRFEHYSTDAAGWIKWLKQDKRFATVTIIGHSEGSLLGMIAARQSAADAFVSAAGAGQKADQLIRQQLQAQPPQVKSEAFSILDSLVDGKNVPSANPAFAALFRPSVQPYLISWFRYDPQAEIKKLSMPVLIIQGKQDIQVSVQDASLLAAAKPDAKTAFIEGMNHILKASSEDLQANVATYSNPSLPVVPLCIETIAGFISSAR